MRNICKYAVIIHFCNKFTTIGRQPAVAVLGAGAGEDISVIPDRVDEAHPPGSHRFQMGKGAVQKVGTLDAQEGGGLMAGSISSPVLQRETTS